MFARSLDLVEECGLAFLHVFPYSPRPGTPAARMPQVPPALVRERAARLRAAGAAALAAELARRASAASASVLVERPGCGRSELLRAGRSSAGDGSAADAAVRAWRAVVAPAATVRRAGRRRRRMSERARAAGSRAAARPGLRAARRG